VHTSARVVAFSSFIILDIATTFIGLSGGQFIELAPSAYWFGSGLFIVVSWLLIEKFLAFFGLEWLIGKFSRNARDNLIFYYGVATALGLAVSLNNIRWLLKAYMVN
jgi:hypothetical protein